MADFVGRTLGPYQITQELGHGGMANVYLAAQTSVGRQVAIKVLPSQFLQDRTFLDRFTREVKLITQLQHPRILPIYDFGEQDGVPYIVMALMTGGTLSDVIQKSRGGMGADEIARLVGQAAEGLDYAHEQGIIHRDFKPSNVLLDVKGNVHLADFGIAKATADTAQITGSGFIGTPAYAAPEMSTPEGLSPRVDVYALGVTLYQMLTGRLPYDAPTPMGVLMAHMAQPIPDVLSARPDLPEAVQYVLEQAMAKNPDERYQSAGDLADDLRSALGGAVAPSRPAASRAPRAADPNAATIDEDFSTEVATSPMTLPAAPSTRMAAQPTRKAEPQTRAATPAPQPKSRLPMYIGAAVGAAVLLIGGILAVMALTQGDEEAEATPFVPSGDGGSSVDLEDPMTESAVFSGSEGEVYSFGFSPDGSRLIMGEITKLSVWDVEAGTLLFEPPTGGVEGNINAVAYSLDGQYLMATIGYCINSYEAENGEYIGDYCEIGPLMYALDFSPDGSLIAGGSGGSVIGMYETESREMLWAGEEHEGDIHAVVFSPDGSMVASASADARVIMWDVASGDSLFTVEMDTRDIWDMDLSPDGIQGAAGASNGWVLIFDAVDGDEIRTFAPDGSEIRSVAYSPDGAVLAVGTIDGSLYLYDAESGAHITDWDAHDGAITQLTWLSGSVLVSSGTDGRLVFWE